ncbi:MAG: hypothetical protein L6422_03865 [Candidatus Marinimicrobia bacterium]|nr:hypothetical protein [bacterium]MCG2715414.1 hypothetical protein [Candidatus Neomarinimicrobiota bacterium]
MISITLKTIQSEIFNSYGVVTIDHLSASGGCRTGRNDLRKKKMQFIDGKSKINSF